jgi:DNA-binding transcriptional MerR regulator
VLRLYRILALRRLRFSLAEIRSLLDDPQWDLASMVARHAKETDRVKARSTPTLGMGFEGLGAISERFGKDRDWGASLHLMQLATFSW